MCRIFSTKTYRGIVLLAVVVFLQSGQAAENGRSGELVYQTICQYCHATGIGPEIRARQLPAAYTTVIVRQGLRAMPAFRLTEISDQELERVAAFIEHKKKGAE